MSLVHMLKKWSVVLEVPDFHPRTMHPLRFLGGEELAPVGPEIGFLFRLLRADARVCCSALPVLPASVVSRGGGCGRVRRRFLWRGSSCACTLRTTDHILSM